MGTVSRRKGGREQRGIDELPSGALRVRVYAGIDPVTKKRHDLTELIPAGPQALNQAIAARERMAREVRERTNPRTKATVNQLLDRYLDHFDGAPNTKKNYRNYARMHVRPFIGNEQVGAVDADMLDSLYAELRRCRVHCDGSPRVDHRTSGTHTCDDRCKPHKCKPLGATTIRHIHFLLSGAFRRAKRWKWVSENPVSEAEPPAAPAPKPTPPTLDEAARIVTEAWKDPEWGALIWLAMTSGARRGELCALRWSDLVLEPGRETMWLRRAISRDDDGEWAEQDTKSRQQRRVALDAETAEVLSSHRESCEAKASMLEVPLASRAFVLSQEPDGSRFTSPDTVSQRYARMVERLEIDTTLHKLRHYSATELISAGVDVRTVAGRLGHAGGGTTTLRTYAAWVSEADQRAATDLAGRMPTRPSVTTPGKPGRDSSQAPYERIAASIRDDVLGGALPAGTPAPSLNQIQQTHGVSVGTANRVRSLLKEWGVIDGEPGKRSVVAIVASTGADENQPVAETHSTDGDVQTDACAQSSGQTLLDLRLLCLGAEVRTFTAMADADNPGDLQRLLAGAARRHGGKDADIADYELEVRIAGSLELVATFAAV